METNFNFTGIEFFLLLLTVVLVAYLGFRFFSLKKNETKNFETSDKTILLSKREKEVFALLILNKGTKEIANELFIDVSTVKTHTNRIYKQLEVKDRDELIAKYKRTENQLNS